MEILLAKSNYFCDYIFFKTGLLSEGNRTNPVIAARWAMVFPTLPLPSYLAQCVACSLRLCLLPGLKIFILIPSLQVNINKYHLLSWIQLLENFTPTLKSTKMKTHHFVLLVKWEVTIITHWLLRSMVLVSTVCAYLFIILVTRRNKSKTGKLEH